MSQWPNRIGRVVFETSFHGRERVSTLQNRISAFAAARLQAILAESLSLLAGREDLLIFYSVELELGRISFDRLEEDLEAGILRGLHDWALRAVPLHRRKLADATFGSAEPGHRDASAISLANLLSASRALASPVPQQDSPVRGGLNAAVASALRGSGDWPQLLAIVRENQAFRSRLANEVSPELLRGLLQFLIPANGTAMAELAQMLVFLHDAEQLVSAKRHAFQRAVWECVLTEVARYQTAGFSLRALLSRVLDWLAARYSVRYSLLAAKVEQGLQELSRTSASAIPANILGEINTAVPQGKDDPDRKSVV